MGAAVIGRIARIRWAVLAGEEAFEGLLLRSAMEHLLANDAEEIWGFLPDPATRLAGPTVSGEPSLAFHAAWSTAKVHLPPLQGPVLLAAEVSTHAWAALKSSAPLFPSDVHWMVQRYAIPGIEPVCLARPSVAGGEFELRWPPQALEAQAPLRGELALLSLADLLLGERESLLPPLYRYWLWSEGTMHWLDVLPDVEPEVLPDVTRRFRKGLARFGGALRQQGIWFEDHTDYAGYELDDAIEDAAAPDDFGSGSAPLVLSVSAAKDLDERRDRALLFWDPDEDISASTHGFRIDLTRVPGLMATYQTAIAYVGGEVEGEEVSDEWIETAIEQAAGAAGLVLGHDGLHHTVGLPGSER